MYLAGHIDCNKSTIGAFRALKQGYVSWASGRLGKMEVNRPDYCHVRTAVKASMRSATYSVYLLLHVHTNGSQVSVETATCPCAAGLVSQSPLHTRQKPLF